MNFLKESGSSCSPISLVMMVLGIVAGLLGLKNGRPLGFLLIICAIFWSGWFSCFALFKQANGKKAIQIQIVKPGVAHPKVAYLFSAVEKMAERKKY